MFIITEGIIIAVIGGIFTVIVAIFNKKQSTKTNESFQNSQKITKDQFDNLETKINDTQSETKIQLNELKNETSEIKIAQEVTRSQIDALRNDLSENSKITNDVNIAQEVHKAKLEELTREVRVHNNFAQRVPVLEKQVELNRDRIDKIEEAINE